MKVKKLLMLICIMLSTASNAQNNSLWLEKGIGDALAVAEFKHMPSDSVFNYIYVELDISNQNDTRSNYLLISRDQKWWDIPVWVHGEFRSFVGKDFSADNIFLAGLNTELYSNKYGFLNVQTMYRYDGHSTYQLTFLSDWEYKRFFYSMYADIYGYKEMCLHTENRFFFKVMPHVRVGANLVLTAREVCDGFDFRPMALIRVDL